MNLNFVATQILYFSSEILVVPILLMGYIWDDKRKYQIIISLLLLNMIFNPALKAFFQVPLKPHLGSGWSYPSGHMQNTVVLYGAIGYLSPGKYLRIAVIILLTGIGWALVQNNYHTPDDIAAAVVFGTLLLISFYYHHFYCDADLFFLGFGAICYTYLSVLGGNRALSTSSFYALYAFVIAHHIIFDDQKTEYYFSFKQKIYATIFFISTLILSTTLLQYLALSFLNWAVAAFLLPWAYYVCARKTIISCSLLARPRYN